eukprot:g312.t1
MFPVRATSGDDVMCNKTALLTETAKECGEISVSLGETAGVSYYPRELHEFKSRPFGAKTFIEFSNKRPRGMHFTGHGERGGRLVLDKIQVALTEEGHVNIAGTESAPADFFVRQIRALRRNPSLEFVFINCCHSLDLGIRLVEFVPYVICWGGLDATPTQRGGTVLDAYARSFAAKFYEILAIRVKERGIEGPLGIPAVFEQTIAWVEKTPREDFDAKMWRPRLCVNAELASAGVEEIGGGEARRRGGEILRVSKRHESDISPLHPKTRVKPLGALRAWATGAGETHPLFWIQGAHGVGKSALVKAMVTKLRKVDADERVDVAAFFAKAKHPKLSKLRDVMYCWYVALRLSVRDDDVDLTDTEWQGTDADEELLRTYVFDPLAKRSRGSKRTTVLVLDALDECAEDGVGFVETVAKLVMEYCTKKDGVDVRLLVSSTTKPRRDSQFHRKNTARIMQLGSKKDPSLDTDIELFSRDQISEAVDALEDPFETGDVAQVARVVRERSQKCFLYAKYAVKLVREAIECGEISTAERLGEVVHAFPPGLSALLFDYATRPFEAEESGVEAKMCNQLRETLLTVFLAVGETCPMWLAQRVLEKEAEKHKGPKMTSSTVSAIVGRAKTSMKSLVKQSKETLRVDAVIHDWILLDRKRFDLGQMISRALDSSSSRVAGAAKVSKIDDEAGDMFGCSDDEEEEETTDGGEHTTTETNIAFAIPTRFESRPGACRVQYLREKPEKAGAEIVETIVRSAAGDGEMYVKVVRAILSRENQGRTMLDVSVAVRMTRRVEGAPVDVLQRLLRYVQKEWGTVARGGVSVGQAAAVCLDGILRSGGTRNVADFAIVVSAWCKSKQMKKATKVLDSMRKAGVTPNDVTFNTLIRGWCELGKMGEATKVLDSMLKAGLGKMGEATKVLDSMLKAGVASDDVTFTTLIRGWCELGKMGEATKVLDSMLKAGVASDDVTFNTLIRGWCELGKMGEATKVLDSMLKAGVNPNDVTFNTLIRGWCNLKQMDKATRILRKMREAGVSPNHISYGTIIDGWSRHARKADKAEEVMLLLDADPRAHAGTRQYNTVMDAYTRTPARVVGTVAMPKVAAAVPLVIAGLAPTEAVRPLDRTRLDPTQLLLVEMDERFATSTKTRAGVVLANGADSATVANDPNPRPFNS